LKLFLELVFLAEQMMVLLLIDFSDI